VVKNLLHNALKYTPAGCAPPELSASRSDTTIEITVRDHGDGIAEEHLAHISEPFYRVDPARRRATGGYGLGLYLSRMVVEAHAGTLRIESVHGDGTRVTVSLPNHPE